MRVFLVAAGLAFAVPSMAHAGTCEDSFQKSGSVFTGQRFTASVEVPNLTPASAIGQVRGVVAGKGYDILTTEAEYGSMLIEQPQTGSARSFPIMITATSAGGVGTVTMDAKLHGGQTTKSEAAMAEMCGILNQVQGGKAGLAKAAAGMKAVGQTTALEIDSLTLSQQVSKDTQRNAAAIPLRYEGKSFVVKGIVKALDRSGGDFIVMYDIPRPSEQIIRLPGQAPFKTDIACKMAKGQAAFTLQLSPGKHIKLSGTFYKFNSVTHVLLLQDCRNARS